MDNLDTLALCMSRLCPLADPKVWIICDIANYERKSDAAAAAGSWTVSGALLCSLTGPRGPACRWVPDTSCASSAVCISRRLLMTRP